MLKKEEIAEPNSCLNKAKDDEPIFVLLGRDPVAAKVVRFWIIERIKAGLGTLADKKIQEADGFQRTMEEYYKSLNEQKKANHD